MRVAFVGGTNFVGPVQRWRPDALVDTFAGGATADKAAALSECAKRAGVRQIVAISSIDVYQHCVDAGLADGSGAQVLARDPVPLPESARLREGPYPGGGPEHDNVAMEAALEGAPRITVLRPGAIYGPHPQVRESVFVEQIAKGDATLLLPDGGAQLWHRVAVERVANAVVAALTDHAWQTSHPVLVSDRRLRERLGVTEPDPEHALAETVRFLWGAMTD